MKASGLAGEIVCATTRTRCTPRKLRLTTRLNLVQTQPRFEAWLRRRLWMARRHLRHSGARALKGYLAATQPFTTFRQNVSDSNEQSVGG